MAIPLYAMQGYGSYLKKTSVANTTKNGNWFTNLFSNSGNTSVNQTSNKTNTNKATNNLRQTSDAIPNFNIYTAIAKSAINATAEYFDSMQERKQLESVSYNYQWQSVSHSMNAEVVGLDIQDAQNDVRFMQNNVYEQYRIGEIQALEQGLADAQTIHHERAVTAGSGVRMNSESKAEIHQANKKSAELNQWVIQQNTDSNALNAKINVTNALRKVSDLEMMKANYQAQAIIAIGNAKAANIQAKSIKPLENAIITFGLSMAQNANFGGMGMGK